MHAVTKRITHRLAIWQQFPTLTLTKPGRLLPTGFLLLFRIFVCTTSSAVPLTTGAAALLGSLFFFDLTYTVSDQRRQPNKNVDARHRRVRSTGVFTREKQAKKDQEKNQHCFSFFFCSFVLL